MRLHLQATARNCPVPSWKQTLLNHYKSSAKQGESYTEAEINTFHRKPAVTTFPSTPTSGSVCVCVCVLKLSANLPWLSL